MFLRNPGTMLTDREAQYVAEALVRDRGPDALRLVLACAAMALERTILTSSVPGLL
jgi:hypothetical protein